MSFALASHLARPIPAIAVLVGLAAASHALAQAPPRPVKWSVSAEPAGSAVRPGGRLTLVVTASIDEGWHVYATGQEPGGPRPLRISLAAGQPLTAGSLQAPEPTREFDESFKQFTAVYSKSATFRLPVTVSAGAPAGERQVGVEVTFQACDGKICLPGRSVKLSAPIRIAK